MSLGDVGTAFKFAWDNRADISKLLAGIRTWFRGEDKPADLPGILILGPGGSGKSTLARLLAGETDDWWLTPPDEYTESLTIERVSLRDAPNVGIVIPPGQSFRRVQSWSDLLAELVQGKYRGVILVNSYGHDTFTSSRSYKNHPLYAGDKDRFWKSYCEEARTEELNILKRILSAVEMAKGKVWLLTVVLKQDLWWPNRVVVEEHYRTGEYHTTLQAHLSKLNSRTIRHECVFASVIINNLTTLAGERIIANAAGYDQPTQSASLRRLVEVVEALRQWETES